MREIKFRFWNKQEKKMLFDTDCLVVFENKVAELDGCMEWDWYYDDCEVMQYTGLKDKNGVEIYEGDKVRLLYTDWSSKSSNDPRTIDQYLNDISKTYKVVFEGDRFCVIRFNEKFQEDFTFTSSIYPGLHGFIEVIGNIHQESK